MTRVVIADDQSLIRAGFRMLLQATDDLEVVGEASDGAEAVALARSGRADVVLMDIRMPGTDGIEATRQICSDDDLAGVKVLILTTFEQDEYVYQALQAGASGFLGKGVDPDELLSAVRLVAAGEALLSPTATRALIASFLARPTSTLPDAGRLAPLTPRERELVALVAEGMTNDQIAEHLVISPLTVKTHVTRAMMKVDARDRAQLVVIAYQCGLVRVPRPRTW
ncbi:MAG TPA: response regulator transcription factor [Cellulomonas sp.]